MTKRETCGAMIGTTRLAQTGILIAAMTAACAVARAETSPDFDRLMAIYGKDSRVEVYQATSPVLRNVARRSIVAVVPKGKVTVHQDLSTSLSAPSYPQDWCSQHLGCGRPCADEPFRDQPVMVSCSGVLVDDDLVLTAAHCLDASARCDQFRYVFDWFYNESGVLETVGPDAIYSCRRTVLHDTVQDVALIELDRPVGSSRQPVCLHERPLTAATPISIIGFPAELPAKIEEGTELGALGDGLHGYFEAYSDTYQGSSGSAALDNEGCLVGHLINGLTDFTRDAQTGCLRSVILPRANVGQPYPDAEHYVYASEWRADLCSVGWPSERLCDSPNGSEPDLDGCNVSSSSRSGFSTALCWLSVLLLARRRLRPPHPQRGT